MCIRMVAVVLAVLATACGIYGATDYCALCKDKDHTMCKYTATGPACKPRISGGIPTAAEQAIILDVHNAERSLVAMGLEKRGKPGPQPEAANMAKLVWNSELATIAQRWADQCNFNHDTCRIISNSSVGQNIYMGMSSVAPTSSNWAAAVTDWISEVSLFSNTDVSPFKYSDAIGHYSQVAWATTTSVGCGRTVFKDATDPTWINDYYVCNYAPSGNSFMNGVGTMYVKGKACSQCPAGMKTCSTTSATNKGLCSW